MFPYKHQNFQTPPAQSRTARSRVQASPATPPMTRSPRMDRSKAASGYPRGAINADKFRKLQAEMCSVRAESSRRMIEIGQLQDQNGRLAREIVRLKGLPASSLGQVPIYNEGRVTGSTPPSRKAFELEMITAMSRLMTAVSGCKFITPPAFLSVFSRILTLS